MGLSRVPATLTQRHWSFLLLGLPLSLMFWRQLGALIALSAGDERYTHILVIPFISAALLYLERKRIFSDLSNGPMTGVPLMLAGFGMFLAYRMKLPWASSLSFAISSLILLCIGFYICCYGLRSFKYASFPLLLLVLMIPVPSKVLDRIVAALQTGSAELSYLLFRLVGVPVFRHGMVMSLPGADIEVATQCSGIRSTMALLIAGLVVGHMLLRSAWGKSLVVLCVGPIGVFRNAVRIVVISMLGVYVNKGFFSGNLHHRGGLVFATIGFAALIAIVWLARSWERRLWAGRAHAAGHGLGSGGPCSVG